MTSNLTKEKHPKVAILLCTYNGQQFLAEQLESIEKQTFSDWKVWSSDDGSTDGTLSILATHESSWSKNRLLIKNGPQKGLTANFLSLVCDPSIDADFFAYCDQDDIWDANKLQEATNFLASMPESRPVLYCSRSKLVNAVNHEIGLSPIPHGPLNFANALAQNVASGNTMIFNRSARDLLMRVGAEERIVIHDWWTYLLVTGAGGIVKFDDNPLVRYRQHGGNQIGMNLNFKTRLLSAARGIANSQMRDWMDRNLEVLDKHTGLLTSENVARIEVLKKARSSSLIPRLRGLIKSGIFRHSRLGNLNLLAAAILNKL